jgi:predicted NUDIX family NTP pyrophosphohydrolase
LQATFPDAHAFCDKVSRMQQVSAGLLMYRNPQTGLEVFLVHPGGPVWTKKDLGAWSIPKGLIDAGEDKLEAAKREFLEETSFVPSGPFICLGEIRQKSGKRVYAWAFEGNCDPSKVKSNTFTGEWPPKSGQIRKFPEIDKGEFFSLPDARRKINQNQAELLDRLEKYLASPPLGPASGTESG